MELVYFRDPRLNFGDDLNAVIWDRLLSAEFRARDDIVLVGIGSILTAERLEQYVGCGKTVVVAGSGVSYGTPPSDMSDWYFAAVRGPLSAAVLGRPEAAITDGAILLAATDSLVPRAPDPRQTLFIPHRSSLRKTDWAAVCARAGLTFLSPQTEMAEVLRAFGQARLVVAEAMHGAIVADTLRIPWVPVVVNPEVDEFKWRDWTRSMGLPYRPVRLRPAAAEDLFVNRVTRRNLGRAGIAGHTLLEHASSVEACEDYLERRFGPPPGSFARPTRNDYRLWRLLRHPMRALEPFFMDATARSLRRVAGLPGFLSDERVFAERLERMVAALAEMEARLDGRGRRLAAG